MSKYQLNGKSVKKVDYNFFKKTIEPIPLSMCQPLVDEDTEKGITRTPNEYKICGSLIHSLLLLEILSNFKNGESIPERCVDLVIEQVKLCKDIDETLWLMTEVRDSCERLLEVFE